MRVIELTVSPKGDIKLETKGYSGQECLNASSRFKAILGKQTATHFTAEAFCDESQKQLIKE